MSPEPDPKIACLPRISELGFFFEVSRRIWWSYHAIQTTQHWILIYQNISRILLSLDRFYGKIKLIGNLKSDFLTSLLGANL